jgi:hypothetical protein
MLLKEHRFKFVLGTTHIFTIEEMVQGLAVWPHKFRLRLPASSKSEAKSFYGASCYEVAEKAAQFIAENSHQSLTNRATYSSQGPSGSLPQTLRLQGSD